MNVLMPTLVGNKLFISQYDMNPAFVSAVMAPNLKIKEISHQNGAGPYSQPEGGHAKAWIRATYQKWPKKMPGARPAR